MQDPNPYTAPASENPRGNLPGESPGTNPQGESEFVLSGCLTVADAIAAHRLAIRGVWIKLVLAMMVLIACIIVLVAIGISSRPHSPRAANVIIVVAGIILPGLLLVFVGISRFRLHIQARKQFGMFAPTHTTFSHVNIISTSDSAKSVLEWSFFSHYRANEKTALLYLQDSDARIILARSKLQPPATWDELLELIRSKLPGC